MNNNVNEENKLSYVNIIACGARVNGNAVGDFAEGMDPNHEALGNYYVNYDNGKVSWYENGQLQTCPINDMHYPEADFYNVSTFSAGLGAGTETVENIIKNYPNSNVNFSIFQHISGETPTQKIASLPDNVQIFITDGMNTDKHSTPYGKWATEIAASKPDTVFFNQSGADYSHGFGTIVERFMGITNDGTKSNNYSGGMADYIAFMMGEKELSEDGVHGTSKYYQYDNDSGKWQEVKYSEFSESLRRGEKVAVSDIKENSQIEEVNVPIEYKSDTSSTYVNYGEISDGIAILDSSIRNIFIDPINTTTNTSFNVGFAESVNSVSNSIDLLSRKLLDEADGVFTISNTIERLDKILSNSADSSLGFGEINTSFNLNINYNIFGGNNSSNVTAASLENINYMSDIYAKEDIMNLSTSIEKSINSSVLALVNLDNGINALLNKIESGTSGPIFECEKYRLEKFTEEINKYEEKLNDYLSTCTSELSKLSSSMSRWSPMNYSEISLIKEDIQNATETINQCQRIIDSQHEVLDYDINGRVIGSHNEPSDSVISEKKSLINRLTDKINNEYKPHLEALNAFFDCIKATLSNVISAYYNDCYPIISSINSLSALTVSDYPGYSNTPVNLESSKNIPTSYLEYLHGTSSYPNPDGKDSNPGVGNPNPGVGNPNQGDENQKPDEGNQKPDEDNQKPDEDNQKPDEGNQKPDEGNQKPDGGNQNPGVGNPNQGGENSNPSKPNVTSEGLPLESSNLEYNSIKTDSNTLVFMNGDNCKISFDYSNGRITGMKHSYDISKINDVDKFINTIKSSYNEGQMIKKVVKGKTCIDVVFKSEAFSIYTVDEIMQTFSQFEMVL